MALVSPLQRRKLLCCQIDAKALFAFFFFICCCFGVAFRFFAFPFVSERHILSNSSNLNWSDAFMGRSAKFLPLFISLFCTGISYLFILLPVDPLKCILFMFLLSCWVLWSSFIHFVWVGTDNWIGTSCPLERKKAQFLLPNLSMSSLLYHFYHVA